MQNKDLVLRKRMAPRKPPKVPYRPEDLRPGCFIIHLNKGAPWGLLRLSSRKESHRTLPKEQVYKNRRMSTQIGKNVYITLFLCLLVCPFTVCTQSF